MSGREILHTLFNPLKTRVVVKYRNRQKSLAVEEESKESEHEKQQKISFGGESLGKEVFAISFLQFLSCCCLLSL